MSPFAQAGWHPGRVFGQYEVLAPLGRGGMAEVVRARTLGGPWGGQQVALKRLLPELAQVPTYVQRFAREGELATTLHSPHIVQTLEVGLFEGICFIVMEWVDGRDLAQVLRKCRERHIPVPVDFAVYLTHVLLEALDYAHHAESPRGEPLGLIHCDVSPSNVFISRGGEVKLGDFGIARVRTFRGRDAQLAGKPYYLAPEVLQGEVHQGADVWAVAVMLYELLTLQRPFQGRDPESVFAAIEAGRWRPLYEARPEAGAALDAAMARALDPDASRRFATAADFAQALAPLYDERVGTTLAIAALVRGLFGATEELPAL
ncbi:MAG: serine/threonine-protein kinase [Myxococcaceae bacterium]